MFQMETKMRLDNAVLVLDMQFYQYIFQFFTVPVT